MPGGAVGERRFGVQPSTSAIAGTSSPSQASRRTTSRHSAGSCSRAARASSRSSLNSEFAAGSILASAVARRWTPTERVRVARWLFESTKRAVLYSQ